MRSEPQIHMQKSDLMRFTGIILYDDCNDQPYHKEAIDETFKLQVILPRVKWLMTFKKIKRQINKNEKLVNQSLKNSLSSDISTRYMQFI